jgi:hypothetical protein
LSYEEYSYADLAVTARELMPIRVDWRVRDFLDVVDYTDPASPTLRPAVNVPGQLAGLSAAGSMLYLLGTAGAK